MDVTDAGMAWKYEKIYDTVKMKKMEGFESPFRDSKEPRRLIVDAKKLQLQEELGMVFMLTIVISKLQMGDMYLCVCLTVIIQGFLSNIARNFSTESGRFIMKTAEEAGSLSACLEQWNVCNAMRARSVPMPSHLEIALLYTQINGNWHSQIGIAGALQVLWGKYGISHFYYDVIIIKTCYLRW